MFKIVLLFSSWILPEGDVQVAESADEEESSGEEESSSDDDATPVALPQNWARQVDEKDRVYYYNTETQETSWTMPEE